MQSTAGTIRKDMIYFCQLPTKTRWEYYTANIPNIPIEMNEPWWLATKRGKSQIYHVDTGGDAVYASFTTHAYLGVRPEVIIKDCGPPVVLEPGEKYLVGKTACTAVSKNRLLTDKIVCMEKFDTNGSNEYFESSICKFLDSKEFKDAL